MKPLFEPGQLAEFESALGTSPEIPKIGYDQDALVREKLREIEEEKKRKQAEQMGAFVAEQPILDRATGALQAGKTLGTGALAGIKGMIGEPFGLDPEATMARNIAFPDVLKKAQSGQPLTEDEQRELMLYGYYAEKGAEGLESFEQNVLDPAGEALQASKLDPLFYMPGARSFSMLDDVIEMGIKGARDVAPVIKPMARQVKEAAAPVVTKSMEAVRAELATPPVGAISPDALGLSSRLSQAIDKLQARGTGPQFLAQLKKMPGVPQKEIEATGLDDYLSKAGKVDRDEIQDFLAANRAQLIEDERAMGGMAIDDFDRKSFWKQFPWLPANFFSRPVASKREFVKDFEKRLDDHINDIYYDADGQPTISDSYRDEQLESFVDLLDWANFYPRSTIKIGPEDQRAIQSEFSFLPDGFFNKDYESIDDVYQEGAERLKDQMRQYRAAFRSGEIDHFLDRDGYKIKADELDDWYRRENDYLQQYLSDVDTFASGVKHNQLALPGGENYREVLFKTPVKEGEPTFIPPESHYENAENTLGSIRMTDRVVDGKPILFAEEVQSDWAIKGAKEGYAVGKPKVLKGKASPQETGLWKVDWEDGTFSGGLYEKSAKELASKGKMIKPEGTPDNPFKNNWYQPVMNRFLIKAAQEGKEGIGLTNAEVHIQRYNLRNYTDKVVYNPKLKQLELYRDVDSDRPMRVFQNLDEEKLRKKVGDETAAKLLASDKTEDGEFVLSGEALEIGGEGKQKFYDKILPEYLNKLGKKYGVQVEKRSLDPFNKEQIRAVNPLENISDEKAREIYYFPITEEMRADLLSEGLPLFAAGGAVSKHKINKMNMALNKKREERNLALKGGGSVSKGKLKAMSNVISQRMAKGGAVKAATKGALEAVKSIPKVNRLDMSFKDVTKRIPELTEAAKKVAEGKMSHDEYAQLVNALKPVTPYEFVPQPALTEEAIRALAGSGGEAKAAKYGALDDFIEGETAKLRLDIPAYSKFGVWVNSIHRARKDPATGKTLPTVYNNVSAVRNARMIGGGEKALKVAQGEAKSPFAVIEGGWLPVDEASAVKRAQEYMNDPEWVQVGYDPERHSYFYDRKTMQPVEEAEEVLQIGPLVLAKRPRYGDTKDYLYKTGGLSKAKRLKK